MTESMILVEAIVASIAVAVPFTIFIVDVLPWMYTKYLCRKGHNKFYYVANTRFPDEHAYWCGRCSYESSDEADERKRKFQNYPIFHVYSRYDIGIGRI